MFYFASKQLIFIGLNLKKKIFKTWLLLPVAAIFVFVLTQLAASITGFTETWYAQKIYPHIAKILSTFSSFIPVSLDDIFYILLVASLPSLIFLMVLKKNSFQLFGKIFLNVFATVYILFYALWGFNYFREDLNKRLGLVSKTPDLNDFFAEFRNLLIVTNHSYCTFDDFNKNEIDILIEESYKKLAPALKIKYPMGKRKAKKISFARFFGQAGISGYYGPFFNEVHVNPLILPVEYPFVLAHEKAHQFGITGEAEANFYAWLVCTNSNSKQLKYSANLHILRFFMYEGLKYKEYPEIMADLDEIVKADFRQVRENWMKMRNENIEEMVSKANDTYLKTNKVEKGIEDYNDVVKFVMDFTQDSGFRERWNLNPD